MDVTETINALTQKFGESSIEHTEFRSEHSLTIPCQMLADLMQFCRHQLGFDLLIDITSIDHADRDPRFEVVYELCRIADEQHLRIKIQIAEDEEVPTVSEIWKTADWHEREVYDMMGIKFIDHPDLRRILMWEGYPFFPLRKEFPLAGKPSEMPDVASTDQAPLEGGPFVTSAGAKGSKAREPRARS